jgi:hypothetical protein
MNYTVIGDGQRSSAPVCTPVTTGVFTPFQLTNTQITWPANACYRFTVTDPTGKTIIGSPSPQAKTGYQCVQMSSSWCTTVSGVYTCNMDNYPVNQAAQAAVMAPTLSAGTFTSLPAGSSPSCTVTGASPNYTLSCGLPQGAAGAAGTTPTFTIGSVTNLSYGSTPTATLSGGPNYTLSFGIPAGAPGGLPLTGGTLTGALNGTSASFSGNVAGASVSAPSLTLNGGAALTSQSSANSQIVTCPPGGTSTQYCGADGAWHATASGSVTTLTISASSLETNGDSITNGYLVTNSSNAYINRLLYSMGPLASLTNRAVSGNQACDSAMAVFKNDTPTIVMPQPLNTLMIGTNDANNKGAGAYEATFNKCHQAILSFKTVPSQNVVLGSTVVGTSTGTCSTDTTYTANQGIKCTASGSTATFNLTTTGGPIYIWYRSIDGDAGTFTYSVDGGTAVPLATAATTPINTGFWSLTTAPFLQRVTGVAAGAHAIVFTQTHSGTMPIIGVGTPSSAAPLNALPNLVVANITRQKDGANATAVAAYNADVASNIALLQADGLNLYAVNVTPFFAGSTAAADMADVLHPDDAGQGELYSAFASVIHVVRSDSLASALMPACTQMLAATYTVNPVTDHCFWTYNSSVAFTLPTSGTPVNYTITLYNITGGTDTLTSVAGVPSLSAGQAVTALYLPNGNYYPIWSNFQIGYTPWYTGTTGALPSAAISAGTCTNLSATVTGVSGYTHSVVVTPLYNGGAILNPGLDWSGGYVSNVNAITIPVCNLTSSSYTPNVTPTFRVNVSPN